MRKLTPLLAATLMVLTVATGCKSQPENASANTASSAAAPTPQPTGPQPDDNAPSPDTTMGFDGHRALEQVKKQVAFGPRPAGSVPLKQLQSYLKSELASYGCKFDVDDFNVDTPAGNKAMENILVKIPGEKPGIILLGTHYDTKILEGFVGADDGASSTAVMLEIARNLCAQPPRRYAVWIAFFDGEEATKFEWSDADSVYGSREMTARLANSGDLPKIKAFLLADLVGGKNAHFKKDTASTPALVDEVWKIAANLGYSDIFVNETTAIGGDDHFPFTKRHVPSVDVIDLDIQSDVPYWHTINDTTDKLSAKSLAITGHVFLATIQHLQSK
ncbi:MAG TPA: M28 family peptidase [Candidatus Dormibacteraeota bacterium]|nr:M28 family peptidase [Candidatus Dormibacteraeota bacterium]